MEPGANRRWGYFYLVNRNSGQVADVYQASTSQGADVVQWPNHGDTNQQWSLVQV